jgi:sarcosine/dimethylglycine N-methyltransferase
LTRSNPGVELSHVRAVYDGVQARLYELFMGQQIHVGGLRSSIELADAAGIGPGMRGVELCCGSGASMRFLVRGRGVASIVGVEAATAPVERGREAVRSAGLDDRIRFVVGDATATDLPDAGADFVWGEDAWCYVVDKRALLSEAVRLVRPGGVIAITDWLEGPTGLSDAEAQHVLQLMTFPSLQSLDGYRVLLEDLGCDVAVAEDTGRFGPSFDLYARTLRDQLSFDALELLDFADGVLDVVIEQLIGFSRLGEAGKVIQGRVVARKRRDGEL